MTSSNTRTKRIINSLVNKKFNITSSDSKITQEATTNPIVVHGMCNVSQSDNGTIHLECQSTAPGWNRELMWLNAGPTEVGTLITSDRYFTIEGTSQHAMAWRSEHIFISRIKLALNVSAEADIRRISMEEEFKRSFRPTIKVVILGKINFPWLGAMVADKHGSETLILHCNFSFQGVDISIKQRKGFIEIDSVGKADNDDFIYRIIEALSIYSGISLKPLYIEKKLGKSLVRDIFGFNHKIKIKGLLPPLNNAGPEANSEFVKFITCYLSTFKSAGEPFYGYWHKTYTAYQASLETMSLSLAVAIEGIIKKYYAEYTKPSASIVADGAKVKSGIKSDKSIPPAIKSRLMNAIPTEKSVNISAAIAEINSKFKSAIDYKRSWSDLRNASAHADEIDREFEAVNKNTKQTFECLTLLYRLLFLEIGYTGRHLIYPGSAYKTEITTATK